MDILRLLVNQNICTPAVIVVVMETILMINVVSCICSMLAPKSEIFHKIEAIQFCLI